MNGLKHDLMMTERLRRRNWISAVLLLSLFVSAKASGPCHQPGYICCNGPNSAAPGNACCGTNAYTTSLSTCCNNVVVSGGGGSCCGTSPNVVGYNPATEKCCNGHK